MEISQIVMMVGTIIMLGGGASIFMRGELTSFPIMAVGAVIALAGALFTFINSDPSSRYISENEKRAAQMFTKNCKQVNFIQANNTTGLGLGVSAKGTPVVGTVSSSNEDSYVYSCDDGIQYTLTYDIEKYRQFYK